jgi:hypothetical protein
MSMEKRRFARVRPSGLVPKRGTIVVDARLPALGCMVIDVSAGGACVQVDRPLEIPARVTFVHGRTRKSSRVAWRNGYRLGLQF